MSVTNAVGVIGLGAMGRGMASSLRRAGYVVHACDARPGAAAEFAADGGVASATPAEVAAACPVVISVVVNAAQTESVLFGDHGAAAAMAAGSVFVMCSTVDPNWSIALETRLQQLGLLYLDAPISGGAAKAARSAGERPAAARVIRRPGLRFHVTTTGPLDLPRNAEGEIDVRGATQMINTVIEGWVREEPAQWLWFHRRWRQ